MPIAGACYAYYDSLPFSAIFATVALLLNQTRQAICLYLAPSMLPVMAASFLGSMPSDMHHFRLLLLLRNLQSHVCFVLNI